MELPPNQSLRLRPNSCLQAALTYTEKFGFSVIPIRPDKKPYIKWEEYQKKRTIPEEIRAWWNKWPGAMIGIVTGRISGIVVIDIDTEEGREAIQDYIPDSLIIPTATTPKGGQHLYFKCPENPPGNNARTIPGCDLRAEGGYIIAPPSMNGATKCYEWLPGLSIEEVELPALPDAYLSYLNAFTLRGYVGGVVNNYDKLRKATRTTSNLEGEMRPFSTLQTVFARVA